MKTRERQKDMPTTIENTEINEFFKMLQDQHHLTPNKRFTITYEVKTVEAKKPHYDVPKKYPDDERQLVREAMAEADKAKQEGFDREKAFDNLFRIQEKINEYAKNV